MGKFRQCLTELSIRDRSVFSFPDDNFSKLQWIFTKLGVCIEVIFFSSGTYFVQQSRTILAILVKRHKRNIAVKLF